MRFWILFFCLFLLSGASVLAQDTFRRDLAGVYLKGLPKVKPMPTNRLMSERELATIDVLNSIRRYPKAAAALLRKRCGQNVFTSNEASLYKTLMELIPDTSFYSFDSLLFASAVCHATSAGRVGYVGHDRLAGSGCIPYFSAECINFGRDNPVEIIFQLLIDNGVPSLGHRIICLDPNYTTLAVAIRYHQTYNNNAVLDFGYLISE
jgi:hypothetical protein